MEFGMMFMFLLLGGGNNTGDLLDYTPTELYWEMREQRVIDIDTMSAVLDNEDATTADTLMAIRAIGERILIIEADPDIKADPADKAKALKVLAPLVKSKEPFMGQYAKRSIAWIKGQEPESRLGLAQEVIEQDLALLPGASTLVGQMKIANGVDPVDLASMIPDAKIEGRSMRDMMMSEMLPGLMQAVQAIGNARADLVTFGTNLESEDDVQIMLAVRGQYDRVAVQLAMEDAFGDDDDANFYSVDDVEVIAVQNYDPFAILLPSDNLFVLLFSEDREAKLPIAEVVKKIAQADRQPEFGVDLSKQIDAIDRTAADLWVAMKVTKLMKEERGMRDIFGAFDAARASAVRDTKGMLNVQWVGEGTGEAAVRKAAEFMTGQVQEVVAEMKAEKQHMPKPMQSMIDPMINMMASMTFEANGKSMVGGMKVDPNIGMTMPMMMMPMGAQHHHDHDFAEDAVEEAP